ncbi:MAG: histidine phosphatase family protein [Siphonobacter sp.]
MKIIYLVRHGETEYNRLGIVQGSGVDSDLNERGRAQARAFFETYKKVPFDRIYTSALKRTVQSVQGFIDTGIPFEQHAGLNEFGWGEMEGKTPHYTEDEYYRSMIYNWRIGNTDVRAIGGDSPQSVKDRQLPVLDLIVSRTEEKTILVCMHGRAIRILLTVLFNEPLSDMDHWEHSNLCLYKIRYDENTKHFSLELGNDTRHLAAITKEPEVSNS